MKETIRAFITNLEVDDVGFAGVTDYHSPRSPQIANFFPEAKSIIVLAYKELSSCESPNMQFAMNGRLDVNAAIGYNNYKILHFLENKLDAKVLSIPGSFTLDPKYNTQRGVSDFSLRHAAVAAGLGFLGRNNLVIHPRFGSRVRFSAILTNLELASDPGNDHNPCIHCNLCVKNCPAQALDREGFTDVQKCMKVSQPFGTNSFLMFVDKFANAPPEEKSQMLSSFGFLPFYQAVSDGSRGYDCFNCLKVCPVGRKG